MFGALNWFDLSAAACGEMVFDLVLALGVPLTTEIATHVYIAILTDTGSFHYSNITPRTFDICRQCMEAGSILRRSRAVSSTATILAG
jgi:phosphoesterase RecJ-like protein